MGHTRAIRGRSGPPPARNLWGRNDCDNSSLSGLTSRRFTPGRRFTPEVAPSVVLNHDQDAGRLEFQGPKQ